MMVLFLFLGVFLFLYAFVIPMNTSTGGTRSDYNDGSSFLAGLGVIVIITSLIGLIVEIIR